MHNQPEEITLAKLEVIIMPNGEVLCMGTRVGYFKDLKKYLSEPKSGITGQPIEDKPVGEDHLTLKWGTLKSWKFHTEKAKTLLKEYSEIGSSVSAMAQRDTQRQKDIICELIDEGDFEQVFLDWDGKYISKEEAKKYVQEYK